MECGGCTECCTLFPIDSKKATGGLIEVINISSPAGTPCDYCEENVGCKVHNDRPKICRDFYCAYAQQKNAPIDLRPDKCGIIFEKMDDTMFVGTVNPDKGFNDFGMGQILSFNKQGYDVVLVKHDTIQPKLFCVKENDEFNVLKKFTEFRRISNGCTE